MKTKRFYQLTSYLLMAVCVTLFAGSLSSCNDESIADEVPVKSGKWQISIPATIDINADTRAVVYDESNKKLKAEFRTSDDIYVFKNGDVDSQALHPDNNGTNANLEGDLDRNYEVGDELILAYNTKNDGSVSFTDQEGGHVENGELDKFDYAMATVTVTSASNGNIKTTSAKFQSLQSMYKFTFVDEDNEPVKVTKVTVRTKNNDLITSADILGNTEKTKGEVTTDVAFGVDAIPTGEVWMALSKASNSADTFYFSAIDNNNKSYMGSLDVASNVIQNGKFYTAIVKLKAVEYTDLSAVETANTYMVTKAGKYKFKATVKGNGGIDPLTGITATPITGIAGVKVLWELYGQGRAIKHDGSDYDIFYSDDYVYFSSPEESTSGDCYVAVYDNEGTILWSWLIWRTPEVGTKSHNEKTFMDRNLGAIDVGNCMRGFLYEWGRKDAFSAANGGYEVYPYVPVAATVFTHITGPYSMDYTIKNPTQWIRGNDGSYSWMYETEYSLKPWQPDVKTIYDPCPSGWRIPVKEEISSISEMPDTGIGGGYDPDEYYKGFGNPGTGYYWTTSTDEGSDQRAYAFCNDGRNINHWGQDQGYAIRPVKE